LHQLSQPDGIKASLSDEGNYSAVFTRDAVMAGIVGLLLNDEKIIKSLVASLENLRKYQGPGGQIASNYRLDTNPPHISFGTLSPKVDSSTWYLIGVSLCIKKGILKRGDWEDSIHLVIQSLELLEYNNKHLIYIPQGGNWADEYLYDGYVLYDQVLRYWGTALAGQVFEQAAWSLKAQQILDTILDTYKPDGSSSKPYHSVAYQRAQQTNFPYYLASLKPSGYNHTFDLAANALLALVSPKAQAAKLAQYIEQTFLQEAKLPPVFYPIIDEHHPAWPELSTYFLYVFKNKPHHYHNGGIWWIWLGWLALAFKAHQLDKPLNQLIDLSLAKTLSQGDFAFHEYLASDTYLADGTKNMAYTASGLLMLQIAKDKIDTSLIQIA
jgi:hypothetical protein